MYLATVTTPVSPRRVLKGKELASLGQGRESWWCPTRVVPRAGPAMKQGGASSCPRPEPLDSESVVLTILTSHSPGSLLGRCVSQLGQLAMPSQGTFWHCLETGGCVTWEGMELLASDVWMPRLPVAILKHPGRPSFTPALTYLIQPNASSVVVEKFCKWK